MVLNTLDGSLPDHGTTFPISLIFDILNIYIYIYIYKYLISCLDILKHDVFYQNFLHSIVLNTVFYSIPAFFRIESVTPSVLSVFFFFFFFFLRDFIFKKTLFEKLQYLKQEHFYWKNYLNLKNIIIIIYFLLEAFCCVVIAISCFLLLGLIPNNFQNFI